MKPMTEDLRPAQTPSLWRRLGAMLYDTMILLGILMLAVTFVVLPYQAITGAPYPHHELPYRTALQVVLVSTLIGFFLYFWTHGGQTIGMRAWRFGLLRDDGAPLGRSDALRRLAWAAALFGPAALGLLWLTIRPEQSTRAIIAVAPATLCLLWTLIDRNRLAWHDRLSRTRPIMKK